MGLVLNDTWSPANDYTQECVVGYGANGVVLVREVINMSRKELASISRDESLLSSIRKGACQSAAKKYALRRATEKDAPFVYDWCLHRHDGRIVNLPNSAMYDSF